METISLYLSIFIFLFSKMNFSFALYEQEAYSKKFETKKESEKENLIDLKNNFFNEKDQI